MMVKPEFQAVVLAAGSGSRMREITEGKLKCLLPIGNKPLVWYPLMKLQQAGFKDVLLIISDNHKSEIQTALDRTDLQINIEYCTVSAKEDLGTANSLLSIYDKIKTDLLILPCDLISDVNLGNVIDLFRKHDASICSLFFTPGAEKVLVPGPKSKQKIEKDLIAIDSQTSRLVFHASASDFETDVSLPRALLRKHTNITMYSNLLDSHIYVFKKWILDYLKTDPTFCTIKGELLPYIIRKQLVKAPKLAGEKLHDAMSERTVNVRRDNQEIFSFSSRHDQTAIREKSTYNDHIGDVKACYHGDTIRCYAQVERSDVYGVRVNTMAAYWATNNMIQSKWNQITNSLDLIHIDPKSSNSSTQITSTFLWESSKISDKTSLQNSVIGVNSEVKEKSRVSNSIVMNNVTINERVVLENCIVCDDVTIEKDAQIKNCIIGNRFVVSGGASYENDVLSDADRLMEI